MIQMKIVIASMILLLMLSCKGESENKKVPVNEKSSIVETEGFDPGKVLNLPQIKKEDLNIVDSLKTKEGLEIKYYRKGNGAAIQKGQVVRLNYIVKLENGKILEGNHMRKTEALPFLVGYKTQPPGWDIALQKMHVGDFAEIYIPSEYARGEKEVKGLFPANSDNYLTVEILSIEKPVREVDGVKVWNIEQGKSDSTFTENNAVLFKCIVSTETNPQYFNSWKTGKPFKLKMTDYGIIPGLKKALLGARKGDHLLALIPSEQAYGNKGLNVLVKPNQDLYYYIEVEDILKN